MINLKPLHNFNRKITSSSRCLSITAGIIGPGKRWSSTPLTKNGKPKVAKMHVKKGDYVVVTTGDDKGKTGEVMSVYPKTGQIKVLGAKIVTKHMKPMQAGNSGRINKYEGLLHQSNVMHLSRIKQIRSRVGHK